MNQEFKKEWIEALRSGKYEQGTGQLAYKASSNSEDGESNDYKYCCLGVASKLLADKELIQVYYAGSGYIQFGKMYESSLLPKEACELIGVDKVNPEIEANEALLNDSRLKAFWSHPTNSGLGIITVAELNDNGFTFNEIADLIENYL